jgi:hypothetical protein
MRHLRSGVSPPRTSPNVARFAKALCRSIAFCLSEHLMIAEYVAQWTRHQRDLNRLCDFLDEFAIRLPRLELSDCEEAVRVLHMTLSSAHAYEETRLFPALTMMSSQVTDVLSTFRAHHREDRDEALGIATSIMNAATEGDNDAVSELEIRLPLFARALRRNVQFEEAICRALFASTKSAAESSETLRRLAS